MAKKKRCRNPRRPRGADAVAEQIGDELRQDIRRALLEIEQRTGYRIHLLCSYFVHPSNPKPAGEPVCLFGLQTSYTNLNGLYRLIGCIETTLQQRFAQEIATGLASQGEPTCH